MSVKTDKDAALRFLEWRFGDLHPYYLGMSYQRDIDPNSLEDAPDDSEGDQSEQRKKPKRDAKAGVYSSLGKVFMSTWENRSETNHVYFCTSPLLSKDYGRLTKENAVGLPDFFVDIDSLRELDIDGEEFYADLKDQEPASCWVQTSKQGIQGYFKLDEPILFGGGRKPTDERRKIVHEAFRESVKPLLMNIAYYYGGDVNVVSPARLLRLPGTLNPKRGNYRCKAQYFDDNTFTMAELRKRFKTDEHLVPRAVFYAIVKAMERIYGPGNHNAPSFKLFGTCRLLGLDQESCLRLAQDIFKFFKLMKDDPAPQVEATYRLNPESDAISTLRSEDEDVADEVERAVKFWVALKVKYCKAIGTRWKPDITANPIDASGMNDMFIVKPEGTYFVNKSDVQEMFCNFSLKIKHKLMKLDGKEVDVAELVYNNRSYTFEWSGVNDTTFAKFKTIPELPPKIMVLKEDMWKPYVAWLGEQKVETYLREAPHYGVLDVEKAEPTVLLPNQPHEDYVWHDNDGDTADLTYAYKDISRKKAIKYLTKFALYYPEYHDPSFVWSALGWFAATPFAAFARHIHKGFPVLMVSGLSESGKTHLIKYVLAAHMGCIDTQMYASSTQYARRRQLSSNNLLPLTIDEFRDMDETRTVQFLDLIRNLWDQSTRMAGSKDGHLASDKLIGTLCVVGEHQYQDQATLDRTCPIFVSRSFIEKTLRYSERKKALMLEGREWLESVENKGILGSLIVSWMTNNMDRIPTLLERAKKLVDKHYSAQKLRNAIGVSILVFGLMVVNEIYKEHDVEFPLDKDQMLTSLFKADAGLNANGAYGASNLRALFSATDLVITTENRGGRTLESFMYAFDPEDPEIAYFDMGRWQEHVQRVIKGSASATMSNKAAFVALIHASQANENSPILDFPTDHPIIQKSCVRVNLERIKEQFGINVAQWLRDPLDYEA